MSGVDPKVLGRATQFGIVFMLVLIVSLINEFSNQGLIKIVLDAGGEKATTTVQELRNPAKVTRVVDGDTLVIQMNGVEEKVRLIGINTPETVDPRRPVQCFGKEASNHMKDLANGKNVLIEFDETQQVRDSYGRLLAYVYLEDGQMLNRKMIAEGYAYEYTYLTPYKYQKEFKSLQTFAKSSKYGLWGDDTCAGKK